MMWSAAASRSLLAVVAKQQQVTVSGRRLGISPIVSYFSGHRSSWISLRGGGEATGRASATTTVKDIAAAASAEDNVSSSSPTTSSVSCSYRTIQVQAVHRHGDRSPITPLKNVEYWASTLPSEELLHRVAQGTRVVRPEDVHTHTHTHAAGGRGPFGKLTQMGLLQMVQVGETLKLELEHHTEWTNDDGESTTATTMTKRPFRISPHNIQIYSTDFDRTIQSVQGVLVGFFPDGLPHTNVSGGTFSKTDPASSSSSPPSVTVVDIDCRHTTSWMIPDPQPRRTREQERLELELANRPHILEREAEMRPLAIRCTQALMPLLGEGAFDMAFGVGEDVGKNEEDEEDEKEKGTDNDDDTPILPWAQLAEITKCLSVRDMLPPLITAEDQEAVSAHTAWRWFESLRNPRLAYISMHTYTHTIVHSLQEAVLANEQSKNNRKEGTLPAGASSTPPPRLIVYSCHDSSLIGLLCAFHLEQPSKWPEYGSVLKIELLEKQTTDESKNMVEYVVRFFLNGELLRSQWQGNLREEIGIDKLAHYVSTVGATTATTAKKA